MSIEWRRNGRNADPAKLFDGLVDDMISEALRAKQDEIHNLASSIVDPETGKRAEVISRVGGQSILLSTNGSEAHARELEWRLGLREGAVKVSKSDQPVVYLAHAHEDQEKLARPIAEYLIKNGIDVWYSEWSIGPGESLRQKMDEGLDDCTHFLALLTSTSIEKPWVKAEIDAGFGEDLSGDIRFMGVRSGVALDQLPPLLRTRLLPEISVDDTESLDKLVGAIFDKSRKPTLAEKPHYVTSRPVGLETWSHAAVQIAKHIVNVSEHGCKFDPQLRESDLLDLLDMSADDVSDAVQDLEDSGLVERSATIGSDGFWPTIGLFVEFDGHFLDFDPKEDARALAVRMVDNDAHQIDCNELHKEEFPEWPVRRFNSALNRLAELKVVNPQHTMGCHPYTYVFLIVTDKTRRFAREARG